MFNLNNYLKYIYSILLLNIIYYTTYSSCVFGVSLPDLVTRVDFNCLGLSNLYWLWTNTYYLYTFFLLALLLILTTAHTINVSMLIYLLLLYVLFMLFEAAYNFNMIIYLTPMDNLLTLYNLLLNNSINKIHPLLIYTVLVFIISYYFKSGSSTTYSYQSLTRFISFASLIKFSLFLGGWWAYQEGSWGGWWNWDPSEMFGLLIFYGVLILIHNSTDLNVKNYQYAKINAIILVVYYSFLQLNFSLVSHNFGIRQGDIVDFRVLYFTLLIYLIYLGGRTLTNFTSAYSSRQLVFTTVYSFTIAITLYAILYFSTMDLWSTLIWNVTRIDIYNASSLLAYANSLLLILLVLHYVKYNLHLILVLVISYFYGHILLFALIYLLVHVNYRNIHSYFHQALLVLLIILLHYSSASLVLSDSISTPLSSWNLSLNTPLVIDIIAITSCNTTANQAATSSLLANTPDTKLFSLINCTYSSLQQYIVSVYDITILSNSIDTFNVIAFCAIVVYWLITYFAKKSLLMIIRY